MRRALHRSVVLASLVLVAGASIACASILGLEAGLPREGDANTGPTPQTDSSASPTDGASPDGSAAGATYFALDDLSRWSTFDVGPLEVRPIDGAGYFGVIFDGRHVYFPPYGDAVSPPFIRFDTARAFNEAASWEVSTNAEGESLRRFVGGVAAGNYVYYAPNYSLSVSLAAYPFVRYDRTQSFASPQSFQSKFFDDSLASYGAYAGAVFDGRYVYLVPFGVEGSAGANGSCVVVRYDTTADFNGTEAYAYYDFVKSNAIVTGFFGGSFDGRYVYLSPRESAGKLARLDTTKNDFTAWELVELNAVSITPFFGGSVFDGRYLYFVPRTGAAAARFDTTMAPTTATAWQRFSPTEAGGDTDYAGATFDGRYVYFAPTSSAAVLRYDTNASFEAATSWQRFAVDSLDAGVTRFRGTGFDGRHVYFAPFSGSVFARFEAKSPPSVPSSIYGGSTL